jgi:C4-type Zn-finger protein
MVICPFCNETMRVSEAMEQIIGVLEVTIECEKCHKRIIFKKEIKVKEVGSEYIKLDL